MPNNGKFVCPECGAPIVYTVRINNNFIVEAGEDGMPKVVIDVEGGRARSTKIMCSQDKYHDIGPVWARRFSRDQKNRIISGSDKLVNAYREEHNL